ncbi:MAG: hypothetical protein ACOCYQ_07455, partial [Alkalispirochaeta sp.]
MAVLDHDQSMEIDALPLDTLHESAYRVRIDAEFLRRGGSPRLSGCVLVPSQHFGTDRPAAGAAD